MFQLQIAAVLRELQVVYSLSNTNGKIYVHVSVITWMCNIIEILLKIEIKINFVISWK